MNGSARTRGPTNDGLPALSQCRPYSLECGRRFELARSGDILKLGPATYRAVGLTSLHTRQHNVDDGPFATDRERKAPRASATAAR
jgi:hypothetical protein